jgi:hypothetical protein
MTKAGIVDDTCSGNRHFPAKVILFAYHTGVTCTLTFGSLNATVTAIHQRVLIQRCWLSSSGRLGIPVLLAYKLWDQGKVAGLATMGRTRLESP